MEVKRSEAQKLVSATVGDSLSHSKKHQVLLHDCFGNQRLAGMPTPATAGSR